MPKVSRIALFLLTLLCFLPLSTLKFPKKEKDLSVFKNIGSSSIVIEKETGRVLSESNATERKEMASTTKIATTYCALLKGNLQQEVVISPEMCNIEGSSIYLKAGEIWTLEQLLYGTMLRSGNDAATAVAIAVCGNISAFVNELNKISQNLGLLDTNYENPHGLHGENHYTTALDLAKLPKAALNHPVFAKIAATKRISFIRPDGQRVTFINKNKFLSQYNGACGVKTGFTTQSGRCFVSAATKNDMTLIGVVLNDYNMWESSQRQFDEVFQNYQMCDVFGPTRKFKPDESSYLSAVANSCNYPLTEKEYNDLRYEITWRNLTKKPIKIGQYIGEIHVYLQNRLLFSEKLYTILDENTI